MKKMAKSILSMIFVVSLSFTMIFPAFTASTPEAETKAMALKQLGLLRGVTESGTDFDLDRAPTRTEALVMLIRVLGKESEALNGSWTHPFTDVASWADKYVGYGYEKGLTTGVSASEFGTGNADSNMYLTFMLRALGYSDTAGDFIWNAPQILAKAVGILPENADTANFMRGDIVLVSWAALGADLKGGSRRLEEKLLSEGVFTAEDYASTVKQINEQKPEPVSVSSAEALKTAVADKTVKAISIDSIGSPVVVTGDLVIPAGVTVTVNRGNDFYIEGTLTNNGTIEVLGADSFTADFINYSVLAVQNGGKIINNGSLKLCASILGDEEDRGPVGGQLRIFDGSFENNGSVFLEAGSVNTHGGAVHVISGKFTNNATVVVDGFFVNIGEGTFINEKGAVIINNTTVLLNESGTFTNNGKISGNGVSN